MATCVQSCWHPAGPKNCPQTFGSEPGQVDLRQSTPVPHCCKVRPMQVAQTHTSTLMYPQHAHTHEPSCNMSVVATVCVMPVAAELWLLNRNYDCLTVRECLRGRGIRGWCCNTNNFCCDEPAQTHCHRTTTVRSTPPRWRGGGVPGPGHLADATLECAYHFYLLACFD